ncbi:alpha-amylase/subtilisin inhibitor-like [Phragmites australis]|uniref:alpha-amylase/subtilisin inhibitor-like n=1 Tax=Phragmites australis TaxID=29695 RepID=UPI002D7695A6|nr:alpha-amylase/subtilisin inhibitor-like [Phragmites australis]
MAMSRILLPLLAISLPGIIAGDATKPVYDTDGNELSSDSQYYVRPADDKNAGGDLRARQGELEECPFFLVQARREDTAGLVQFTQRNNSTGGAVHLSSDITIHFTQLATFCVESTNWFVTHRPPFLSSPSGPSQYVAVGTPKAHVDPPLAEVFRIEEHDDGKTKGYKLVSSAGEGPSKDLGLHASSKNRSWMAVTGSPLVVVFKKG